MRRPIEHQPEPVIEPDHSVVALSAPPPGDDLGLSNGSSVLVLSPVRDVSSLNSTSEQSSSVAVDSSTNLTPASDRVDSFVSFTPSVAESFGAASQHSPEEPSDGAQPVRRSTRDRRPPNWQKDFYYCGQLIEEVFV